MYQVHRDSLTTKHVIARSIYGAKGELLLGRGVQLSTDVLKILPETGQEWFWVQDELIVEVQFEPIIREQLALQTTHEILSNQTAFRNEFDLNCATLKNLDQNFNELHKFSGAFNGDALHKSALRLVEGVLNSEAVLLNLHGVRSKSGWLAQHAMESTVTALMIAKKFELKPSEMEEIAIGTLLMDTGYLALPEDLVNRQGRISWEEYQLLRKHPEIGFQILRGNPKIPLMAAHIALQHHENQDGTGFPRHLIGTHSLPFSRHREALEIHRFAEITAVAEGYVRLMHPAHLQPGRNPIDVVKILLKASQSKFNRSIVDALVTMIPLFPVGSKVVIVASKEKSILGWKGIVSHVPQEDPERPVVHLLENQQGTRLQDALRCDLRSIPDVRIQHVNYYRR
jgi:HD-GYP domain-containing protein (c-di-GMP phosphodiesterase class II)